MTANAYARSLPAIYEWPISHGGAQWSEPAYRNGAYAGAVFPFARRRHAACVISYKSIVESRFYYGFVDFAKRKPITVKITRIMKTVVNTQLSQRFFGCLTQ